MFKEMLVKLNELDCIVTLDFETIIVKNRVNGREIGSMPYNDKEKDIKLFRLYNNINRNLVS